MNPDSFNNINPKDDDFGKSDRDAEIFPDREEVLLIMKEVADEYNMQILDALDLYVEKVETADSIAEIRNAESVMMASVANIIRRRDVDFIPLEAALRSFDSDSPDLFAADGEPGNPAPPVNDPESVGF